MKRPIETITTLLLLTAAALTAAVSRAAVDEDEVVWSPHPTIDYDTATIEGFRILIDRRFRLDDDARAALVLNELRDDLRRTNSTVPPAALESLKASTPIWIEAANPIRVEGFSGRGMVFHPSAEWLANHGLLPEKAGGVEICNADDFLEWREHQPMMTLHELAHAYHFTVLDRIGESIAGEFEAAKARGEYERVAYLTANGESRPAYAMSNDREYFAELSEAYFGRNDFFPFTRRELREFDPAGFAFVDRVWNLPADRINNDPPSTDSNRPRRP
ncbi:MAG: hypothetical protein ACF8PN_02190 [Phycisphaerales bacterium]